MSFALFLCNRTENMIRPWLDAGIPCLTVDLRDADRPHPLRTHLRQDVQRIRVPDRPAFVAAFPPCTDLAVSGARWYRGKGLRALIRALETVEACREICEASGAPYMIENPVGTLATYWREPDFSFDPCDYGDPYTKRTLLWTGNGFVMPPVVMPGDLFEAPTWVEPSEGSKMHRMSSSWSDRRSATPRGFAAAVFRTNGRPGNR